MRLLMPNESPPLHVPIEALLQVSSMKLVHTSFQGLSLACGDHALDKTTVIGVMITVGSCTCRGVLFVPQSPPPPSHRLLFVQSNEPPTPQFLFNFLRYK